MGIEAGQRVAHGVADIVHAALEAAEADAREPVKDRRNVRQPHSPDLPVLARGHVRAAVLSVGLDDSRQIPDLLAGRHAVGKLQPHHESPVYKVNVEAREMAPDTGQLIGKQREKARALHWCLRRWKRPSHLRRTSMSSFESFEASMSSSGVAARSRMPPSINRAMGSFSSFTFSCGLMPGRNFSFRTQ